MDTEHEIVVFYSWQSDKSEVKKMISAELRKVKQQLAKEGIKIIIDQDTRGRKKAKKIDEEVMRKIKNCDIFLADITPVSKLSEVIGADMRRDKLMPNSNVMFEYGYAIGCNGFEQTIIVAYMQKGEQIEQLPFDINHDSIIPFNSEEGKPLSLTNLIKAYSEEIIAEKERLKKQYACEVCWEENRELYKSITIHPKYKRIHNVPKPKAINTPFGIAFQGNQNVKATIIKPWYKKTDYSCCPVRFVVANMGEMALENLYVFIEAPDKDVVFFADNTSTSLETIRAKKNYSISNEQHLKCKIEILNPNMMKDNINTFYIKVPDDRESVLLKWSAQSKCHYQEGYLEIIVKPEYEDEVCECEVVKEPERTEPFVKYE